MRNLGRFSLIALLALPAWAGGLDDPLATAELLPLKPSPRLMARVGEAPCATALPDTPLTALDAVDLMLCNHPQTREVWAAARAQAAQLNSYEGLPLLVGAVVMAQTLAVRQLVINEFLLLYLLLRLAYTGAYLANWPAVRSVLWLLGTLCPVVLLVLAAKGL